MFPMVCPLNSGQTTPTGGGGSRGGYRSSSCPLEAIAREGLIAAIVSSITV